MPTHLAFRLSPYKWFCKLQTQKNVDFAVDYSPNEAFALP